MARLRCVVERITYQNAENGYTVLKCAAKSYQDLVTVVGIMPDTHVGSNALTPSQSLGGTQTARRERAIGDLCANG